MSLPKGCPIASIHELPRRGLLGNLESLKHQKKVEVYHGSLSSRERSEQWWNKDKRST
jgi:hypothetical protein